MTVFKLETAFYYSILIAFILCIFPWGLLIYEKYCTSTQYSKSHFETLWPFCVLMCFATLGNIFRLWVNDCNSECVFIPNQVMFIQCCEKNWYN
jgi:hypothetical protein